MSSWLKSYGQVTRECVTGRRSLSVVVGGTARRWFVRRWLASHPGRPFECRMPTGSTLLLDPDHWFIEHYYEGLAVYEPDVQRVLTRLLKPGDTFIDCGANAGFYSVFAQDLVSATGTVVAIEANPALLPQLNANLEASAIGRAAVHAAITTCGGIVDFLVPAKRDSLGGLRQADFARGEAVTRVAVPASTLDDVIAAQRVDHVNLIKIDIEGGELDALASAEQTIARFRPFCVVEYSSLNWPAYGASPEALFALCQKWGYRICRFDLKLDDFVDIQRDFWSYDYANMVMIPSEKW